MSFRQVWILSITLAVIATMILGALTRLTGSGLSMVEWEPLSGILPPLSAEAWNQEFHRYQQFPEFKSRPLDLEGFKAIFWWEFNHRLLARSLVFIVLLPFLVLLVHRQATLQDFKRMSLLLLLIAVQGGLGWYMVKSGLVQVPHVSHLRLMVHLVWGSLIVGFLARWLRLESPLITLKVNPRDKPFLQILIGLCLAQMALGALVAGSRAGYMYNTFPKMGDSWGPPEFFFFPTLTENLIYNHVNLQFFHRLGGWILLGAGVYAFWRRHYFIATLIGVQFLLGVFTLIFIIPIPLAALHQLGAILLFYTLHFSLP